MNSRGFPIPAIFGNSGDSGNSTDPATRIEIEEASMRKNRRRSKSRNMDRQPIVLKDYEIPSYFARRVRYNERALVYSGLLADRRSPAAFAGGKAAPRLKDRTQ